MNTVVYVDVLLALNYIINTLLLLSTAGMAGVTPKRRKIVAAALLGSLSSLTIFFPFMGFYISFMAKMFISAIIVATAFGGGSICRFLLLWFYFFAVNFIFAGVMLGIWMLFSPHGMLYYNGIVYFDISSTVLIITTVLTYLLLGAAARLRRRTRIPGNVYDVQVSFRGKSIRLNGLIDSGNSLHEPFSGFPVAVCGVDEAAPLLPGALPDVLKKGVCDSDTFSTYGIPVRFIPYQGVADGGMLAAFKPDYLILTRPNEHWKIERAYLAISPEKIGGGNYNILLSPDFIGMNLINGGVKQ